MSETTWTPESGGPRHAQDEPEPEPDTLVSVLAWLRERRA